MADAVTASRPAKAHPQSIAEDILDKLQATYPKLYSAKGELVKGEDGNEFWRFEIATRSGFKSECSFPVGTPLGKIYGSFLGWCDTYKIKLGMRFKKADEEDEAA